MFLFACFSPGVPAGQKEKKTAGYIKLQNLHKFLLFCFEKSQKSKNEYGLHTNRVGQIFWELLLSLEG